MVVDILVNVNSDRISRRSPRYLVGESFYDLELSKWVMVNKPIGRSAT